MAFVYPQIMIFVTSNHLLLLCQELLLMLLKCTALVNWQVPGVLRSTCGRPGEVVCRIAEDVDAAYVIIGDDLPSEGMGRVWRAVVGGSGGHLTSYLLHHVACPVIIVRDLGAYQQARFEDRRRHFSSGDPISGLTTRLRRIRFASGSAGSGMTTLRCADVSAVSLGSEQCELVNDVGDNPTQEPDAVFNTWAPASQLPDITGITQQNTTSTVGTLPF